MDNTLGLALCSRDQLNAIAQLMHGKASQPLFSEGQAIQPGSFQCFALQFTMIMRRHEPDIPDGGKCHAIAIIFYDDGWVRGAKTLERHRDGFSICIVCILDEFKDRQAGGADELITQELQQSCTRPEWQLERIIRGFAGCCHQRIFRLSQSSSSFTMNPTAFKALRMMVLCVVPSCAAFKLTSRLICAGTMT
ncbi:hypothetical protein ACY05_03160 [Sterolibacterium denitrificans]|uniref:Uncharacterized protein n=1 Tax=Sterolibacterium denitrificans TaxID=157592 RepID=A0A656ZCV9_9PROT|nr:hypothetical protein ACY05_03160 [Sterolibacterium denitrificans]